MSKLTHLNDKGEARMVDVGAKEVTQRIATAEGFVTMRPATLRLIQSGTAKKGDVLAAARIAGIMAAKRTHDLIPMCHPLMITKATVDFTLLDDQPRVRVEATVAVTGQTGVEMEALTAVTVAGLTIYDMLKAVDREMTVTGVRLLEKHGGKSGSFSAAPSPDGTA